MVSSVCSHDSTYIMAQLLSLWLRLCRARFFAVKFLLNFVTFLLFMVQRS
jgi:hypothetical protein